MTTKTEGKHAGEFLLSEANGQRSRANVTIVSGQNLSAGAVLGKVTASGKYKAYDDGAGTGEQTAVAILLDNVDASLGDVEAAAFVRDCEVNGEEIAFASGVDEAGAIVDLASVGIIVR